jgi:hypothetical protein
LAGGDIIGGVMAGVMIHVVINALLPLFTDIIKQASFARTNGGIYNR